MNYIKELLDLKSKTRNTESKTELTRLKKNILRIESRLKSLVKNSFLIILGILSATLGLKGFLIPNNFIDGGVTGISLIIFSLFDYPIGLLLVVFNIPFLLLGLKKLNLKLILKSIGAITLLAVSVHFIDFPTVTEDKLLIATFGGLFLGGGIGLAIRGGAVLDGTEILAIVLTKVINLSIGDFILLFNIIIFSFAAYFMSIEIALYAILTYIAASKTVDFIIDGIEEYTEITIISDLNEEIRQRITEDLGKGVTIFKGKGGYSMNKEELKDRDILYTVLTRLEISNILEIINAIDTKAFVIMNSVKDIKGGIIKTKAHHKHIH